MGTEVGEGVDVGIDVVAVAVGIDVAAGMAVAVGIDVAAAAAVGLVVWVDSGAGVEVGRSDVQEATRRSAKVSREAARSRATFGMRAVVIILRLCLQFLLVIRVEWAGGFALGGRTLLARS